MVKIADFSSINIRGQIDQFMEKRYAYTGSNLEYEAWSKIPNASTAQPIWFIVKYTYTGSSVTRHQLPDDGVNFDYVWDDRATYFS